METMKSGEIRILNPCNGTIPKMPPLHETMRRNRAIVLALGMIPVFLLAMVLYQAGPSAAWFPGCLFHRFTGLDCPGCGMTRAAHAARSILSGMEREHRAILAEQRSRPP